MFAYSLDYFLTLNLREICKEMLVDCPFTDTNGISVKALKILASFVSQIVSIGRFQGLGNIVSIPGSRCSESFATSNGSCFAALICVKCCRRDLLACEYCFRIFELFDDY